jgi:hypothetical protein
MPQLDLMTFSTQFFWFSLCFSTFYIIILHFVLSPLALILKYRKKKLNILANTINKKKQGASLLLNTYDYVLLKTFNFSKLYLLKIINYAASWLAITIVNTNAFVFLVPNKIYISTITNKNLYLILFNFVLKRKIHRVKLKKK